MDVPLDDLYTARRRLATQEVAGFAKLFHAELVFRSSAKLVTTPAQAASNRRVRLPPERTARVDRASHA